jgi:hypothetical protein
MAEYIHESHSIYDIKHHNSVGNKISVQNTHETNRREVARTAQTGVCGARDNDSGGEYRERACAYAHFVSAGHNR